MDCTFTRSSALISSSPTIQCDIQQKKILSLFYRVLLSFRPCQEYLSLVFSRRWCVGFGDGSGSGFVFFFFFPFLFFLSTELFLLCILLQCTISAFRYDIIIVPAWFICERRFNVWTLGKPADIHLIGNPTDCGLRVTRPNSFKFCVSTLFEFIGTKITVEPGPDIHGKKDPPTTYSWVTANY